MTTPNDPTNPNGHLDTGINGQGRPAGSAGGSVDPAGMDPHLVALQAIQQAVERSRTDIVAQLSRAGNLGGMPGARSASHTASSIPGGQVNPTQGQPGGGGRTPVGGGGDEQDEGGTRYSTLPSRAARGIGNRIATNSAGEAVGGARGAIGGAVAESGGTVAGLTGALKKVPYVGTAILMAETAQAGYHQVLDQMNAGRSIQEIEGGSQLHAQGTRYSRWTSRFHYMGEDSKTANEQFNNATALGYTDGAERRAATDWQYHQTTARGMSTAQEASTLQVAANNGQTSLDSLTKSIYDVSTAANHAGVNAKLARDKFIDMFKLTTGNGFGQSANGIADALTSSITSMGRQFNNVTYGGTQTRNFQYRLAGEAGMTAGQFQGASQRDPMMQAQAITNNGQRTLDSILPQPVKDFIKQQITAAGGGGAVKASPGLANQIADMIVQNPSINSLVDTGVLVDILTSQMGLQGVDQSNAWQFVVQWYAGQTPAAAAASLAAKSKTTTASAKDRKNASSDASGLSDGYGASSGAGGLSKDWLNKHAYTPHVGGHFGFGGSGGDQNQGVTNYLNNVSKTGKQDPVIQALLKAVPDPNQARVEVQTGGANKVMSLAQAIRDFPDELAAGNVRFVQTKNGGKDAQGNNLGGRTTADVAGMSDTTRNYSQEITDSRTGGKTSKTGENADDYYKKNPPAKGDGQVQLTIAPPFDQIFRQMVGGSSSSSSASGSVPINTNALQASRP